MFQLFLFFLAFVCFMLALFGVPGPKDGGWLALGLAFLTIALAQPLFAEV